MSNSTTPVDYSGMLSASLGGISNVRDSKGYFVGNVQLGLVVMKGSRYSDSEYEMNPYAMHLLDFNAQMGRIEGNFTIGYEARIKAWDFFYPGFKIFYGHLNDVSFGAIAPTANLISAPLWYGLEGGGLRLNISAGYMVGSYKTGVVDDPIHGAMFFIGLGGLPSRYWKAIEN